MDNRYANMKKMLDQINNKNAVIKDYYHEYQVYGCVNGWVKILAKLFKMTRTADSRKR